MRFEIFLYLVLLFEGGRFLLLHVDEMPEQLLFVLFFDDAAGAGAEHFGWIESSLWILFLRLAGLFDIQEMAAC